MATSAGAVTDILVNRLICYAFIVADPAKNIYTDKSLKQIYISLKIFEEM
nr:MAG TPA: hypothetical protein [Caudoviricetes sp.]